MSYLYHVSTIAKDHYAQAGRDRKYADNELNQIMPSAKMVGIDGDYRIFESANKKWRLFLHKSEKVIEDVKQIEEIPVISEVYKLTDHAKKRAKERFGISNAKLAESRFNYLLKGARLHSVQDGVKQVYDHYTEKVRIIVNKSEGVIVTVIDLSNPIINADSPLFSKIAAVAKRELNKAGAAFRKQQRELTTQISAIKIEIAKSEVNLINAKAPHIKRIIRDKISDYTRSIDVLMADLERKQGEFERIEKDAQALLGENR